MATEGDLSKQCVPISSLKKFDTNWVLKLLVIRNGTIKSYKTHKSEGLRWPLTFVDEEGTKIQAILFNEAVDKWKGIIQENMSFYIINGRITGVNPKYSSVHKEFEMAFSNTTIVTECLTDFSTIKFSDHFVSFEETRKIALGTNFDVVGILIKVKPVIGEGKKLRREIFLINDKYDRIIITLWGEIAEKEGDQLSKMVIAKPIVALCDVKGSSYQGTFGISTTPISSVLINTTFEKSSKLKFWYEGRKAENMDISLMSSKLMKETNKVRIVDVMNTSSSTIQESYCTFDARITNINNKDEPWYCSCKICQKKVNVVDNVATCGNCLIENASYNERFILKLDVSDGEEHVGVTLFDAVSFWLGCDETEFIESISQKKENSKYYRKIVLSVGKEFRFLVRTDKVTERDRVGRRIIAEEIEEIKNVDTIDIEEGDTPAKFGKKKKKVEDDNENSCATDSKKIKMEK